MNLEPINLSENFDPRKPLLQQEKQGSCRGFLSKICCCFSNCFGSKKQVSNPKKDYGIQKQRITIQSNEKEAKKGFETLLQTGIQMNFDEATKQLQNDLHSNQLHGWSQREKLDDTIQFNKNGITEIDLNEPLIRFLAAPQFELQIDEGIMSKWLNSAYLMEYSIRNKVAKKTIEMHENSASITYDIHYSLDSIEPNRALATHQILVRCDFTKKDKWEVNDFQWKYMSALPLELSKDQQYKAKAIDLV